MEDVDVVRILRESLIAAARGPFFPDWEFHTLFGFQRVEMEAIAEAFTATTPHTGDVARAINNAILNLIGYPHDGESVWSQWLSVSPAELQVVHSQWRAAGKAAS